MKSTPAISDMSLRVHRSAFVIDTHADTPQRFLDEKWHLSGALEGGKGHLSLPAARAGGLGAEFFVAWVDPGHYGPESYVSRTLELLESVKVEVRHNWADAVLCTSSSEIEEAHRAGRFAALLAVEGGHSIADSLQVLRTYYELGARYLTLTWANSNNWAESATDLRELDATVPSGLTEFGRQVIAEMNRLGMIVDVSHSSDKTLEDVLAVSRAPVLATHSCARALCDSPRNLTDEQLRAIAAQGGAVMVIFYSAFLDEGYRRAWNLLKPERDAALSSLREKYAPGCPIPFWETNAIERRFAETLSRPPFEALMRHFEHIIAVAGVDHVGIGTDFDGIPALPQGIDSAADLIKVTDWLLQRGYSEHHVRKVLGGNLLRVFREVEAVAEVRISSPNCTRPAFKPRTVL